MKRYRIKLVVIIFILIAFTFICYVKVDKAYSSHKTTKSIKTTNIKSTQQTVKSKGIIKKVINTSTKKIIVIDPGHASGASNEKEPMAPGSKIMKLKESGGAEGIVTHNPEYLINMDIAKRLKRLLEYKGYKVVMTKTENYQMLGNIKRAEIANGVHAALAIRIHADSSSNAQISGTSMLVPAPINSNTRAIYKQSKLYGKTILDSLVRQVGMKNKGVVERKDLTGFNWSRVPVVLVEVGFLSNKREDKLLSQADYKQKIALGLANGIQQVIK